MYNTFQICKHRYNRPYYRYGVRLEERGHQRGPRFLLGIQHRPQHGAACSACGLPATGLRRPAGKQPSSVPFHPRLKLVDRSNNNQN